VTGGVGRSELPCLGGELSFLGFFAILLLRWSPLAMTPPDRDLQKSNCLIRDVKATQSKLRRFGAEEHRLGGGVLARAVSRRVPPEVRIAYGEQAFEVGSRVR
jgi:hypothetical protein